MRKIDKTPEQIRQEALEAMERDRIELAKPENVVKAKQVQALERIKKGIYRNYPPEKQQQDLMWTNYHRTNLVAAGEADVEAKVVGFAQAVIGGKTIAQAIKSVNADFKPAYTKLVKIALRTSWARQCIDEGLAALAESREPEYPPFPEL